jgi:FkbM family methyltransferase
MKRSDLIKLNFSRNWNLPGKARITKLLHPSAAIKTDLKNGIIWLKNENIAIYTSADNYIEYFILTGGDYENELNKLINISLKPGFVALDIGANIGIQSMRMSQCVGATGKIYSFEPLAHLQKKFKRNIALNNCGNVKLFPWALSDKAETLTMNVNEHEWNQGSFNLGVPDSAGTPQQITVKVPDDIDEIRDLERIDLIKVDVEGFEYPVLRGLLATLKKHNPRIIFEYDQTYWSRTGQDLADCIKFLTELDYTVYQITPVGCELLTDVENVGGDNLFCMPKSNSDPEK